MQCRMVSASVLAALVLLSACGGRDLVTSAKGAPRALCLRNVRVFDAPRATVLPGLRDVLVRDGRIAAMSAAGMNVSEVTEIDGKGGTLLPGLIDLHTHTGAGYGPPWKLAIPRPKDNLEAFLYAGVTSVLDLGNLTPEVFRQRGKIGRGELLGPHLYAAGPIITAPEGHPVGLLRLTVPWWLRWYIIPRFTRQVATPEEARAAVDALLPEHPDILKIAVDRVPLDAPRISGERIAAIAAEGHANGVRTIAHVGRSVDVIDAVAGGVDALAHIVYPEEISDEAVAAVSVKRLPVIATISVFDSQERFLLDDPPPYTALEREVAGPEILAALRPIPPSFDQASIEPLVRSLINGHEARRRNVAKLRAAGVMILAGSDSPNIGHFPGASLHVELRALVAAGMTPGEALRAATYDGARFLAGDSADFGEIAPGRRADLVLVQGDPLADIGAIDELRLVILDGVVLERHRPAAAVD